MPWKKSTDISTNEYICLYIFRIYFEYQNICPTLERDFKWKVGEGLLHTRFWCGSLYYVHPPPHKLILAAPCIYSINILNKTIPLFISYKSKSNPNLYNVFFSWPQSWLSSGKCSNFSRFGCPTWAGRYFNLKWNQR